MSGPDREVSRAEPPSAPIFTAATASSPPPIHDSSLSASPTPSVVAPQRHSPQNQHHPHQHQLPHQQQQQIVASEAAAASSPGSQAAAPDQQHHHDDDDDHAASASLPPFEPIFTLLTNNTTNTTVHPRVHYLFSDDDASAVLAAPPSDPSHRALVVDLAPPAAPNGKWTVSWASSLTPDFAVTASQLSLQQHGNDGNEAEAGSTSVMLRVEGVEREAVDARPNSLPGSGSGVVGREDVEQLTEEFKRRMNVLKKVVDEGERRKESLSRLHDEMHHPDEGDYTTAAAVPVEDDTSGNREPERRDE